MTLTVTDRGGNTATHHPDDPGARRQRPAGRRRPASSGRSARARVRVRARAPVSTCDLQLLPQSLKTVLRNGISVRVTSNAPANGIATVSITRASAKKAHIQVGAQPVGPHRPRHGLLGQERHRDPAPAPLDGDGEEAEPPPSRRDDGSPGARRLRQPSLRDRRRRPLLDRRLSSDASSASSGPPRSGWRAVRRCGAGRRGAVGSPARGARVARCEWVISCTRRRVAAPLEPGSRCTCLGHRSPGVRLELRSAPRPQRPVRRSAPWDRSAGRPCRRQTDPPAGHGRAGIPTPRAERRSRRVPAGIGRRPARRVARQRRRRLRRSAGRPGRRGVGARTPWEARAAWGRRSGTPGRSRRRSP